MKRNTTAKVLLVIGLLSILFAIIWGVWLELTGVASAKSLLPPFILLPVGVGLLYAAKKMYK